MKTFHLSPVLLLLALAGPVHAQEIGPGAMLQELEVLGDATNAPDARMGQSQRSAREESRNVRQARDAARPADDRRSRTSSQSGLKSIDSSTAPTHL
jgi:hypothetical protein